MSGKKQNLVIRYLVEQFSRAAIVTHFGYEDEDNAMQLAGLRSAKQAIQVLDTFGPDARLALVPLLDDPDWSIRVFAAGYLAKIMPERALPALQDIRLRAPTRARMTAFNMLQANERGELDL